MDKASLPYNEHMRPPQPSTSCPVGTSTREMNALTQSRSTGHTKDPTEKQYSPMNRACQTKDVLHGVKPKKSWNPCTPTTLGQDAQAKADTLQNIPEICMADITPATELAEIKRSMKTCQQHLTNKTCSTPNTAVSAHLGYKIISRNSGIRRIKSAPELPSISKPNILTGYELNQTRLKLLSLPTQPKRMQFDEFAGEMFARNIIDIVNGSAICLIISIAHQLGLFSVMDRLSDHPRSAASIAHVANKLNVRYVQELLSALTCAGIVEETMHSFSDTTGNKMQGSSQSSYAGSTVESHLGTSLAFQSHSRLRRKYRLPPEHAAFLTWSSGNDNLALLAQYIPVLGRLEDDVVSNFHSGSGLSWTKYGQFDLISALETSQTIGSADKFEKDFLNFVPGLAEELREGISVLCLGSGLAQEYKAIARAYPKSWFTFYDTCTQKTAAARKAAQHDKDLRNIHFCALKGHAKGAQNSTRRRDPGITPQRPYSNACWLSTRRTDYSSNCTLESKGNAGDGNAQTSNLTKDAAGIQERNGDSNVSALQEKHTYDAALIIEGSIVRDSASADNLLRSVCCALRPGRSVLYMEYQGELLAEDGSDGLSGNGSAAAPFLYCLSTMQSVPLGLDAGGPALGRMWGSDNARRALEHAGFATVTVCPRQEDQVNVVLVAQAPASCAGNTTGDTH